ncbi:MAG: metallophosphoesterase [Candidatus Aenigmatarchaeota archaeon]
MLIAATGDIHSPINYELFIKSIDNLHISPHLFLISGDIVDRKSAKDEVTIKEIRKVSNAIFGKINCPIISCFGNNEFEQDWEKIIKSNPEIKFLQDESMVLEIEGNKVGIVGSKGSLDRPTIWQRKNLPDITNIYQKRVEKINELLLGLNVDYKILLIHYPPTYKILSGENPSYYPELACSSLERLIVETKVNLVITGHVHKGKKEVWINGTPVINVGLTLNNGIVVIDTEKLKRGLSRFL